MAFSQFVYGLSPGVPQVLKPAYLLGRGGTAEEAAEKLIPEQSLRPQRLKPHSKQCSYRSAEALHPITPKPGVLGAPALRHPKSSATPTFSAACEAVPNPKPEHNLETVKPVRP
jgi:hypothetical protein